jgi:hypothetical protein
MYLLGRALIALTAISWQCGGASKVTMSARTIALRTTLPGLVSFEEPRSALRPWRLRRWSSQSTETIHLNI